MAEQASFTTVDKPPKTTSEDMASVYERLKYQRPIPGQSLTQDPEQKLPYERPPEFTNYDKAQDWLFNKITSSGPDLVELIAGGTPLDALVNMILMSGFQAGKWNVDLMLLLIEPTYYILIFVAEVAGIEYVFSSNDAEFVDADTQMQSDSKINSYIKKASTTVQAEVKEEGGLEAAQENLPASLLSKMPQPSEQNTGAMNG